MKRGGGSKKGSRFERQICVELSQWWAGRDDIFWRSAGSGARAKTRGRKGKATMGQHGDISAIDPIGMPFIDAFTIEIKCGYPKQTIHDLLDPMRADTGHQLLDWIEQVKESCEQSGSYSWLLIHKRDRRRALVYMPDMVFSLFLESSTNGGAFSETVHTLNLPLLVLNVIPLEDLLKWISSKRLRDRIKSL